MTGPVVSGSGGAGLLVRWQARSLQEPSSKSLSVSAAALVVGVAKLVKSSGQIRRGVGGGSCCSVPAGGAKLQRFVRRPVLKLRLFFLLLLLPLLLPKLLLSLWGGLLQEICLGTPTLCTCL